MRRALALLALLLGSAPAAAQHPKVAELTATFGVRTGGRLEDVVTGETFGIHSAGSVGFVGGIAPWTPNLYVEGTYIRQMTRVSGDNAFAGGEGGLSDLRVETALAGVQWDFAPTARVRPMLSAGIGGTFLEAEGGGTSASFTASLAGGAKVMASPGFGARIQLRALAIFEGASEKGLCRYSGCHIAVPGPATVQLDLSVGAVFAF